ncbi:MAG: alkaline phosphatase family protein [Candidatus Cybelea sp.]|jgi:phospholipase C
MMVRRVPIGGAIALSIVLAAGCSPGAQNSLPQSPAPDPLAGAHLNGLGKIKHVVYVMQEGRSFNTLFEGYPGANTVSSGELSSGETIELQPVRLKERITVEDSADAMFEACNGTGELPGTHCQMNGFDKEEALGPKHLLYPQYVYVSHRDTRPYFAMAREWVLADNMFASQLDSSFIAHQYSIAAQADKAVNLPDGGACGTGSQIETLSKRRVVKGVEPACFSYATLGGELDEAKLSWRYYTVGKYFDESPYSYIKGFFEGAGARKHIIAPSTRFLSDVKAGKLGSVTWLEPPNCGDSDDGRCGGGNGPAWIAAVVNAVGESKFWDSTAIFVQWDNWGGFYDPVAPKYKDFDGLGFRVPLLVISPYAKQDFVSHVPYETAGVLRFIEDLYGLDQMAAADKRATSPAADCFDFNQQPRKFVPIKAPEGMDFFLHQVGS